jgi:murein DD-endopeptidase MepM/ murein hydrolase activator NlpD
MIRRVIALPILFLLAQAVGGFVTPAADALPPAQPVVETVLKPGETLWDALLRSRLGRSEAAGIIAALRGEVNMRRVQPGERVVLARAEDGRVLQVTYRRTPTERYEVFPDGGGWRISKVLVPIETRVVAVAGRLEGSLFVSMDRLSETPALTAMFVNLFEWDFDFAADSLPGDRFRLLVEKRFALGEFVGYGRILVAQYQSAGRPRLTAVAFEAAEGKVGYFDAEGSSIRKMFLRAPLDFTRITSGYSQARKHPILGGVRPHLAVDYGAPVGTAIRAVADGVVEAAGWDGDNGISITLRHARRYKTMYNHLSKVHVRPGQRVRQRQVIGRVGSTGLSTGPHLDYRVIKHGRSVNPLSERFVPGSPVPSHRRWAFREHLDGLLNRLDRETPLDHPPS